VAVVVVALAAASGCGSSDAPRGADRMPGWTSYHDARHRLTVRFPSAWRRARSSLTPALVAPREILSLGTFPLRPEPATRCAQLPEPALRAAEAGDVFLTIQERGGERRPFPARPRPFVLSGGQGSTAAACAGGTVPWRAYWVPFSDAGRSFYALAVIGERASARRRRELQRVLDGLRFDPAPGAGTRG
jgi:hypothetical protein